MRKNINPFFIFYDARSGSTYLSNLLVQSFNIVIPPESNFISMILSNLKKETLIEKDVLQIVNILKKDEKFRDWNLSIEKIKTELEDKSLIDKSKVISLILKTYLKNSGNQSSIIGIKKDNNINYYEELHEIFPDTKIICLVRDGRAVYNSKRKALHSKTGKPFEKNVKKAALAWCDYLKKVDRIIEKYPQSTMLVKYEDMLMNTKIELGRIGSFLETDFIEKNEFSYNIPNRYGELHTNIDKAPILSRINAWQRDLSKKDIMRYEKIANIFLLKYNYKSLFKDESLSSKIKTFLKIKY
jgi:hypothetical protein